MPDKTKVHGQGIVPVGRTKNIQETEKEQDEERWPQLSANESGRRRLAVTQLRNADSGGKKKAVKEVHLITFNGAAQSEFLNEPQITHEMVEGIAKARSGKYRANEPKLRPFFEVSQKKRVEKDINKQFLEIEIISVEELRNGP